MNGAHSCVYDCPSCGEPADLIQDDETKVCCKKCGEFKIGMKINTNGDIITIIESTGEPYEIDEAVRRTKKALDLVDNSSIIDIISLRNDYAAALAESGREVQGEKIVVDTLSELIKTNAPVKSICEQVALCAFYSIGRGDNATASKLYDDVITHIGDVDDPYVAWIMVKRATLWNNFDIDKCEQLAKKALKITENFDNFPDEYIKVAAYDVLKAISIKKNDNEIAEEYQEKALKERLLLLNDKTSPNRLSELADAMGKKAESLVKKGNNDEALKILDNAVANTSADAQANAFAIMNRARYLQSTSSPSDNMQEEMDIVIESLKNSPTGKRVSETLAQAYMFKSMSRSPEDYDEMLSDLEHAYECLMELAYKGDVNEMFLMSAARSYLVLLNMKDKEKAKSVRKELNEIGISQMDLDASSRSSIGNAGKKTKVDINKQPSKPLPGRRLKRNLKN